MYTALWKTRQFRYAGTCTFLIERSLYLKGKPNKVYPIMCYGLYVDLPGLPRQQKSTLPGTNDAYIFSTYKNAYKRSFFLFIKKY